jgi:hypothetical protein
MNLLTKFLAGAALLLSASHALADDTIRIGYQNEPDPSRRRCLAHTAARLVGKA